MENLPRPASSSSLRDRLTDWITWFGPGRLATSAAAVVLVCAGAYWLTRAPRPPTEAALPSTSAGLVADATLPPPAAAPADPASERVTVHVTGAVVGPGVYELDAGSRVQAAIDLAGGATPDGDPDAINLAAVVADGARIYVPAVGEDLPPPSVDAAPPAGPVGPVDVNRASITELERLPGVGPATAAAIVTERERNGPFPNVDDLQRVPGIGPARLETLRDLVTT